MNRQELEKTRTDFLERYNKEEIMTACSTLQIFLQDINIEKLVQKRNELIEKKKYKSEKIEEAYNFLREIALDPDYIKIIAEKKVNELKEAENVEEIKALIGKSKISKPSGNHTGNEKIPMSPEDKKELNRAIEDFSR